jgi:hypothetical protein
MEDEPTVSHTNAHDGSPNESNVSVIVRLLPFKEIELSLANLIFLKLETLLIFVLKTH